MSYTKHVLSTATMNLRLLNNYRRLRNVRRANNLPTVHQEDVAQHSFYVAILATTLAEDYNQNVEQYNLNFHPIDLENTAEIVDVNEVTKQALFHDMEEAFTSDIPWNVKHHDNTTNSAIQQCIREKLDRLYTGTSEPIFQHKNTILQAKMGLPGKFVNIADNLEGAWYCYTELEMGNNYMIDLFLKYLQVINDDSFTLILRRFSPIFDEFMHMFEAKKLFISENQEYEGNPWQKMLLD